MKHKKISWLIATLFTSPMLAQQALAQEASSTVSTETQQVNVTGIRASVRNALAIKEASTASLKSYRRKISASCRTPRLPNRWHVCPACRPASIAATPARLWHGAWARASSAQR
jgi:hypothetical protein